MRTPSGELHVCDFKTGQIVSSIQTTDYWDDKRHWEIKNNIDTLEFRVFDNTKHSSTLMQQNLVLKEVRDGRIVPYVITEIEKDSDDRSVIAYASGEWIQLAKAGIIPPQKLEGKTVIEMMDIALAGTKWQKGNLEYASFRSMTIDEFIDPLSFLKKIASLFELEIQYRAEVVGSQIVGRYIDMVKKRGQETGKEITLGKDLLGIKRIENSQNICTALLGFVKKEGEGFVTITEINNGVPYLVDNDAFQRWNEKGQHKFGFYSPETSNEDMDAKRLMVLMNTELKKRVNTSVLYEVEAQSIGRVFGLAHELINEGDTIRIKDTGFTPKLYLEARAIAGDESFKNPLQDKYVFGDYHEIIDPNEELRKIYNRIISSLGNKQEMIDQLDKLVKEANKTASNAKEVSEAAKKLAEMVQENIKNNTVEIIESKNPPTTGLKPYKTLWRDISNGKPGILKIWTGAAWESVVPDVESVKKETLDQVSKDIESTKNELNKKVQEAQNQATGQVNEVKESLQGVSRTISDVQNKQGEIDKKVTKFEQDSSGFKTSIESLTKKDTEISSKLNTVESNVEGTKKTISDVQQTTNDLKKTTTEITEQAGKISEKLTTVETKVNSDKAGGRNLLLDSNTKYEKTDYLINVFSLTENFVAGEEYTFVIKGSVPAGQKFGIWMNGGSSNVGYATSVYANGITYVTFKAVAATSGNERKLSLYNSPSNITKATVEWVALYKGNKPQDWTPAPENQVTTDEFTKRTNEITKSVDGIKETVTKVENNQSGFDKRVTEVEKTANGITQNVSKLQETQTLQGKTLTQATTTLEQHSEALNLTMKKKDVEDYVGGLGSINEIRNAGLDPKKMNFWGLAVGTVLQTNSTYKGYPTFWSDYSGNTAPKWQGATSDFVKVTNNEDLVASGYFATDNIVSLDSKAWLEVEFYSASQVRVRTQRVEINWARQGDWNRVTLVAKVQANEEFMRWRYYVEKNGRLRATMPMLQRGKVATEFWLHPKDVTDYDQLMGDISNRVATEQYNKKVTELERSITANGEGVSIISKKHETFVNDTYSAYIKETGSKLKVLDEGILAEVRKGNLISTINQTAEKVKIKADLIDLIGKVEASWLKAGLLLGMTIKTSNTSEYLQMENQVMRFVNQGSDKIVIGFEDERKSKTRNAYIILGEGDGSGRNVGTIYKDGGGLYFRFIDLNGAESNIRLTAQGNIGIVAQDGLWVTSKRANFTAPIETPGIRFNSFGATPGSQKGTLWMGNGYKGFGLYYFDTDWKFVTGS
ncbi:TPA: phage tail spike protein [Bacillus mobilis]